MKRVDEAACLLLERVELLCLLSERTVPHREIQEVDQVAPPLIHAPRKHVGPPCFRAATADGRRPISCLRRAKPL
eukprot:scaffold1390_cov249-Pinguiococcus_pyrenoidosus.AAC.22